MANEPKSIGAALVDVFDAGLGLIKTEVRIFGRNVSKAIKAKGLGVVLLLAALGPIGIAIIFLLLACHQMLTDLAGLPGWGASLIMFFVALLVTVVLVVMGMKKLGAEDE